MNVDTTSTGESDRLPEVLYNAGVSGDGKIIMRSYLSMEHKLAQHSSTFYIMHACVGGNKYATVFRCLWCGVIIFVDTDECQLNSYSIAPIAHIKHSYYVHGQYVII